MTRTYLDHNATSPIRPVAAEAVASASVAGVGNPSSPHAEGRRARALIEQAREEVASLMAVPSKEIVFTSGGSEAVAAAVSGVLSRAPGGPRRVVAGAVEHACVIESARRGLLDAVPCDARGLVDAEVFAARLEDDVAMAALQWANNETGVIQPLGAVASACRSKGIPLLIDAVQAAGKLDFRAAPADALLAVSSHKLGGPHGAGALRVPEGLRLAALIPGGPQERRRRGGTEAVGAIAGFGAAAAEAARDREAEALRLETMRRRFEAALVARHPNVRIHGAGATRLPGTTSFAIPGMRGETVVIALDVAGFSVSTGSACASGAVEASHVLRAMGLTEAESKEAVRVSTGWSTAEGDLDRLLEALDAIVARGVPA